LIFEFHFVPFDRIHEGITKKHEVFLSKILININIYYCLLLFDDVYLLKKQNEN
jgi:hypothetical protein